MPHSRPVSPTSAHLPFLSVPASIIHTAHAAPLPLLSIPPCTIPTSYTRVYRFGSGTTNRQLSNFYTCSLALRREMFSPRLLETFPILEARFKQSPLIRFSSTEAAWHSLKARNLRTFAKFEADGAIGKVTARSFLPVVPKTSTKGTPEELARAKFEYWGSRGCLGIFSKSVANPNNAPKFGLDAAADLNNTRERGLEPDVEEEVWLVLLREKVLQNEAIRAELASVKDAYLVEYSRFAERAAKNGRAEHWAGLDKGRVVYGDNFMGKYVHKLCNNLTAEGTPGF